MSNAVSTEGDEIVINDVGQELLVWCGMNHFLLFPIGSVGAGKSTAMKAAEQFFCDFSVTCQSLLRDASFFYKANTGSVESPL